MQDRVDWSISHLNQNWLPVIFSDESTLRVTGASEITWIGPDDVTTHPTQLDPSIRKKINVWGCITSKGFGVLYFFEENLTADLMTTIYSESLLPTANFYFGDHINWILQEDNDKKHTAQLSRNFKDENDIVVLDWPSNSADLNPIENVWAIIKDKLRHTDIYSIQKLKDTTTSIWNNLGEDLIKNLFHSMNDRLQECIDLEGGRTKHS